MAKKIQVLKSVDVIFSGGDLETLRASSRFGFVIDFAPNKDEPTIVWEKTSFEGKSPNRAPGSSLDSEESGEGVRMFGVFYAASFKDFEWEMKEADGSDESDEDDDEH